MMGEFFILCYDDFFQSLTRMKKKNWSNTKMGTNKELIVGEKGINE
jgi:hypothetical protein